MRRVHRTCPLCEATCGLAVDLDGERVAKVRGNAADRFSRGYLCPKGAALAHFDEDPDRLDGPLRRTGSGDFEPIGWDEAFDEVDRRLAAVSKRHGRDSVALYVGNPLIHSLALPMYVPALRDELQTRNVFSTMTLDTMPKSVACGLMFGDPLAIPVPDIDRTDHLLLLGANPLESNGSLWTVPDLPRRLKALRARGGRLVVVDPRRTRTAAAADQHVFVRPGTDAYLLFGLVHTLWAEGLVGESALPVRGMAELRQLAQAFPPDVVAEVCGVPPDIIRSLARELAAAPTGAVYARLGTCTTEFGTLTSWLVEVLNVLTGNLDRPGGAMFGQPLHALRPPGEPFRLGRWRSRVRNLPETMGELPTATLADEIITPGPGQVRALITIAGNVVLAAPNGDRVDDALRGLDFMVSVDPYLNETTRHADVILPPPRLLQAPHYDVVLGMRAIRRFARYSRPALPLPPDRPSEAEILARLVQIASGAGCRADPRAVDESLIDKTLRAAARAPDSPLRARSRAELHGLLIGENGLERRLDLMLRLGPFGDLFGSRRAGLTLQTLLDEPDGVDLGPLQPRVPAVLRTSSGCIELCPEPIVSDVARLRSRLPVLRNGFVLVGHRQLRSLNSWSHNVPALTGGSNRCTLQMNGDDARRLGLGTGDLARVRGRHGVVEVPVELSADVMTGVVSLPYGWGHGRTGARLRTAAKSPGVSINSLTDHLSLDPLSGTPVFNGLPVDVTPA